MRSTFSAHTLKAAAGGLLIAALVLVTTKSLAQDNVVYIDGTADCSDGHYSDRCGWPSGQYYEDYGGEDYIPLASSGTSSSGDVNRQPECPTEANFVTGVLDVIAVSQQPYGRELPLLITDPYYSGDMNNSWRKFEAATIIHLQNIDGSRQRYSVVMHYMYNYTTGQVAQTKLKNTYQKGCVGDRIVL